VEKETFLESGADLWASIVASYGGQGLPKKEQKGTVTQRGNSWLFSWTEAATDEAGRIVRVKRSKIVGRVTGDGCISEKKARNIGRELYIDPLEEVSFAPASMMSLNDFVKRRFLPEHVADLKPAGRHHYVSMLKHILPAMGHRQIRDVKNGDIRTFIAAKRREKSDRGKPYSSQTVKHILNAISGIFSFAKALELYPWDNPAKGIKVPVSHEDTYALSYEQARQILPLLRSPAREMVILSGVTSLNVAEICGLKWKRVNLAASPSSAGSIVIPPRSLFVDRDIYKGEESDTKTKKRRRIVPLPDAIVSMLSSIRQREKWTEPGDYVFANRSGKALDAHNIFNRQFVPLKKRFALPELGWHTWRRSYATWAVALGMPIADQVASMGHGSVEMSVRYSMPDIERRRGFADQIAANLLYGEGKAGPIQ
jgi:integrase